MARVSGQNVQNIVGKNQFSIAASLFAAHCIFCDVESRLIRSSIRPSILPSIRPSIRPLSPTIPIPHIRAPRQFLLVEIDFVPTAADTAVGLVAGRRIVAQQSAASPASGGTLLTDAQVLFVRVYASVRYRNTNTRHMHRHKHTRTHAHTHTHGMVSETWVVGEGGREGCCCSINEKIPKHQWAQTMVTNHLVFHQESSIWRYCSFAICLS